MGLHALLKKFKYRQYCSSFIATLPLTNVAIYITWPSPAIAKLSSDDSPIGFKITTEEGSWIVSSLSIGIIFGGIIGGLLIDKIGRKNTLLCSAIPLFIPWIMIAFVKSVPLIILARVIAGIGSGIAMVVTSLYNGEIAEKDIRGQIGLFANFLLNTGNLYILGVGPFISYTSLALTSSIIPLLFILLFYFLPESPYYLVKIGEIESAKYNLIKLCKSNGDESINNQLKEIEDTVEYSMRNKSSLWEFISKPQYRRSLILMSGLLFLTEFSGINVIQAYMQKIIESSNSIISPEHSSIIFGVLQLLAVFFSALLIDRIGRRPLYLISAVGCAVTIAIEGIYFFLQDAKNMNPEYLSWLPATALMLYLFMNNMGLITLPLVLLGELFAINIKGVAASTFLIYNFALGFIIMKFFEPLSDAWGRFTIFWIFSGICILGFIFLLFLLPETKGKSFQEIQRKLNRNGMKNIYHDITV